MHLNLQFVWNFQQEIVVKNSCENIIAHFGINQFHFFKCCSSPQIANFCSSKLHLSLFSANLSSCKHFCLYSILNLGSHRSSLKHRHWSLQAPLDENPHAYVATLPSEAKVPFCNKQATSHKWKSKYHLPEQENKISCPVRLCPPSRWGCPPPGNSHPLSSLVNRQESSLTGVCWLSPRAPVSTPVEVSLKTLAETPTETGEDPCADTYKKQHKYHEMNSSL